MKSRRSVSSLTAKPSDIGPAIKHCLNRFTENNEALNARITRLGNGQNIKDKDKRIAFELVQEFYQRISTKCQLGTYSGNMLVHLIDGLDQLEVVSSKARTEYRRSLRDNRELKAATVFIVDRIAELENVLSATREATLYWKFMYELTQLEYIQMESTDDKQIWNDSKAYDYQWNPEMAGPLNIALLPILAAIEPSQIKDAMKMTADLPRPNEDGMATYANSIRRVAERCYQDGFYAEAENLMNAVLVMRKGVYGSSDPIIACDLSCMALIYSKIKDFDKATKANADALAIVEHSSKSSTDKTIVAQQYLRTGSLLVSWGKTTDGIKLMKMALNKLGSITSENEDVWTRCIIRLARACNDANLHDDAISVGCQLLDFFHKQKFGSSSEKNPAIYEVAYSMQQVVSKETKANRAVNQAAISQAIANLSMKIPQAVSLPENVEITLREVAVGYACRYEFKAANVIKDYIEECAPMKIADIEGKQRLMTEIVATPLNTGKRKQ